MARIMSFAMTPDAIRDRSKTVTRRLGWANLKPGDELIATDQSPRSGNGFAELARLRVVSVRRERLDAMCDRPWEYGAGEVVKEGFRLLSPPQFVTKFCRAMHCEPADEVTRIEFEYVDDEGDAK